MSREEQDAGARSSYIGTALPSASSNAHTPHPTPPTCSWRRQPIHNSPCGASPWDPAKDVGLTNDLYWLLLRKCQAILDLHNEVLAIKNVRNDSTGKRGADQGSLMSVTDVFYVTNDHAAPRSLNNNLLPSPASVFELHGIKMHAHSQNCMLPYPLIPILRGKALIDGF